MYISRPYQAESLRPVVSLAFVLPLLLIYELGSIWMGPQAVRSGIDLWMHQILSWIGFGHLVILPLVTAGILLAWHHRINDQFRLRSTVLGGMLVESIGLGLILFWAASAYHHFLINIGSPTVTALSLPGIESYPHRWATTLTYIGSGIYEELLFRLILLVPLIRFCGNVLRSRRAGTMAGIVLTSLLFAALHYRFFNPAGVEFDFSSFAFRFLASIVFSVLFLFRGFGIAVGTHAVYDILTQI